ncbi:MAG: hypothetical protein HRT89_17740 [Lentisphaeria bacterium]|nr:type II secretion system protein GspG [Lentisphaeria bacterium]NQZ69900.1 hypothetical protein [Lentisphaeria bacterium]
MRKRRFTLIEILVVVSILVVLAGILMAAAFGIQKSALKKRTQTQISMIEQALTRYYADFGYYPIFPNPTTGIPDELTLSYVKALVDANGKAYIDFVNDVNGDNSSNQTDFENDGTYLLDPFDEPYYIECPGNMNPESFDIFSKGPNTYFADDSGSSAPADSQVASEDNDDVTNWRR